MNKKTHSAFYGFRIFIIAALFGLMPTLLHASEFIEGLDDVPVMQGLKQMQSNNISFGNSEIRFVEAYLSGKKASFSAVVRFYKETLPQLGWHFIGQQGNILHFERDTELLDIAREKKSPLLVRITLKSKD